MHDQGERGRPLWVDGEMTLRVEGDGDGPDRIVRVDRPFALVGQAADADVRIDDRAVSARHAYLHLDARGVYVVDLLSRSGTRVAGADRMAGWLRPGDGLEIAGRRVVLDSARVDGEDLDPPPCDDDPLADDAEAPLVALGLEPARRGSEGPWTIGSGLLFVGWSSACGLRVRDPSVAKVHAVLVRTPSAAYVVDLLGGPTRVDGCEVRGASALADGASLALGGAAFTVRVGPPSRVPAPLLARVLEPELVVEDEATTRDLVPAGDREALMTWMVEALRQTQGAVLRQQGEIQATLARMLAQVQQDNAQLLNAHLDRIEQIGRELSALRTELSRRADAPEPPPPPRAAPLRVGRPAAAPGDSQASTTWLLERVGQLEAENRTAWKDLLGRVGPAPRRAP